MIVVDASVWIGVAIGDDTFHPRSFAWPATSLAGGEQCSVPTIVFPEVAGAVARRSRSFAEGDRARQLVASTPDCMSSSSTPIWQIWPPAWRRTSVCAARMLSTWRRPSGWRVRS